MKVMCVRDRADIKAGDVVEVPDGAEVSSVYFEPLDGAEKPAGIAAAPGEGQDTPDGAAGLPGDPDATAGA